MENLKKKNNKNDQVYLDHCPQPTFIVGAPRSGSTYLQCALVLHSRLFSLPETKFFQNVLDSHRILTYREFFPKKRKQIPELITPEQLQISFKHLERIGFIKLSDETINYLMYLAENNSLDVCSMLNILMYNVTNNTVKVNPRLWIEKSPRHVFFLEEIFKSFPDAKIIIIFRDLANLSMSNYKTFGIPIIEGLLEGVSSYNAFEDFLKRNPEKKPKVVKVEYEDLKKNLTETLDSLYKFLGVYPLSLKGSEINKMCRDKFYELYYKTEMLSWQPQMKEGKPNNNDTEELFKKHTYLLSLFFGRRYTYKRDYSLKDIFSMSFVLFVCKQIFAYLLFLSKVKIKGLFIKFYRNMEDLLVCQDIRLLRPLIDRFTRTPGEVLASNRSKTI